MINTEKKFKKISKYCMPLKDECIRKEVNEYLSGCTIINVKKIEDAYDCEFENKNGDIITLYIGLSYLNILKRSKHYLDKIVIKNNKKWNQRKIEKRNKGFIVTDIEKEYGTSKRFNNDTVLTDLKENKYILTNNSMKEMLNLDDVESQTLVHLCLIMFKKNIKNFSDLTTKFSTHMNYYYNSIDGVGVIKDNIYPTKTYLNDKEISHTYDLIDGYDKLYRVHDLYNGIINKRNERDIKSIHLGLLTKRGFDLRTYEGITKQENDLIGETLIPVSDEYKDYLKGFFKDFNHYEEKIKLDRESLLSAIDYVMPIREYAKKHVEGLGIPFDEYERMEFDEQLKVNSNSYKFLRKVKNFFKK